MLMLQNFGKYEEKNELTVCVTLAELRKSYESLVNTYPELKNELNP